MTVYTWCFIMLQKINELFSDVYLHYAEQIKQHLNLDVVYFNKHAMPGFTIITNDLLSDDKYTINNSHIAMEHHWKVSEMWFSRIRKILWNIFRNSKKFFLDSYFSEI